MITLSALRREEVRCWRQKLPSVWLARMYVGSMHVRLQNANALTQAALCPCLQQHVLSGRSCYRRFSAAIPSRHSRSGKHAGVRHVHRLHAGHTQSSGIQTENTTAQTQALPQLPTLDGELPH